MLISKFVRAPPACINVCVVSVFLKMNIEHKYFVLATPKTYSQNTNLKPIFQSIIPLKKVSANTHTCTIKFQLVQINLVQFNIITKRNVQLFGSTQLNNVDNHVRNFSSNPALIRTMLLVYCQYFCGQYKTNEDIHFAIILMTTLIMLYSCIYVRA